jgi:hypothetical protein
MKTSSKTFALTLSCLMVGSLMCALAQAQVAPPAAAASSDASSKIQFAEPVYDFGKVSSGELVKHEYAFTNVGNAELEVSNVQPSCGCTTAGDWTRKVPPGKTGLIPIQFNSANYGGPVTKTVTVTSNDKSQPTVVLQLKGTVWKPIDVTPNFAVLNVPAESTTPVSTVVKIINNTDEELTLSPPELSNKFFDASIKIVKPGKEFDMTVSTVPPLNAGSVQAQITIKTSSAKHNQVLVTAWANVTPVVAINPPSITLPPPTPNKQAPTVSIQNNGANPLALFDASVDSKELSVDLKEVAPGKSFTATVNVPENFKLAAGQQAKVTLKSNHPQFPVLTVPLFQLPSPNNPAIVPIVPPPGAPGQVAH